MIAVPARSILLVLLVALAALLLATTPGAAAPEELDSCTTIDESGEYVLTTDVETSQQRCFDITADDVVLDGRDHTVTGQNLNESVAVASVGAHVTVRNVEMTDWDFGVIATGHESTVTDVSGRSLNSNVVTVASDSTYEVSDVDGSDVGKVVHVDHATEVDVTGVTGTGVHEAVVQVTRGGGVSVSDVDGSGGDTGGVVVERSAEVTIDSVQIQDAFLGVSVITTNGATLTDVTVTNTTAGIQFATSRNVTLAGASIRTPRADGVAARNLTSSAIRDVDVDGAGDDGIVVFDGASVDVQNATVTVTDAGVAVLRSEAVDVDGVTTRNGTDAAVVLNSSDTTLTHVEATGASGVGVQVNDSDGTTVRHLTATGVATAFDFRNATDVAVEGGTYVDVDRVVAATDSENLDLSSLRISNRLVSLSGDTFSVSTVAEPPDDEDRVVVPPMLNVTAVNDSGLSVLVDLNTDREYDASELGLYRYDDGWTRLDDTVDADVPGVSVTLFHPASIAVLTNGSVPSARSPTPTATPTATPKSTGPAASSPTATHGGDAPQADGAGFTIALALLAVCLAAGMARRRLGQ